MSRNFIGSQKQVCTAQQDHSKDAQWRKNQRETKSREYSNSARLCRLGIAVLRRLGGLAIPNEKSHLVGQKIGMARYAAMLL
eukprot:3535970-Amphidinium_carterae.2